MTLARRDRHEAVFGAGEDASRDVHLFVHEDAPQVLARYALLMSILVDDALSER